MSLANFSEPFIRRPVGTTLLAIGLLLVGIVAYRFLPVASMPTVDFPTISVTASRPLRRFGLIGEVELGLHRPRAAEARLQALHREIDDRGRVKREQLAEQQPADDGDAERVAQLRAGSAFERQRNGAEQRRQRRHHDRPEP